MGHVSKKKENSKYLKIYFRNTYAQTLTKIYKSYLKKAQNCNTEIMSYY